MIEEWRSIEDLPGYQISSFGRLKKPSGEIQLGSTNAQGYRQFTVLSYQIIHAHKEVCKAFHGSKPFPEAQALHKNGNKDDCSESNMYWGTHAQNMKDRDTHGRTVSGENAGLAKLTWDQVRQIRGLQNQLSRPKIMDQFGISQAALQNILSGKTWREV